MRRPVTSAVITPRSRKMGRMELNARCRVNVNATMKNTTTPVMTAEIRNKMTTLIMAVSNPPVNSTRPVPIRLRTPSTSFMMRETNTPLFVES